MHNNSIVGSMPAKLFRTFNFRIISAPACCPTVPYCNPARGARPYVVAHTLHPAGLSKGRGEDTEINRIARIGQQRRVCNQRRNQESALESSRAHAREKRMRADRQDETISTTLLTVISRKLIAKYCRRGFLSYRACWP